MKFSNSNVFIWTEAYNCGEILEPMVSSYLAHNNFKLNIFGTSKDLAQVKTSSKLLHFHDLRLKRNGSKIEDRIMRKYEQGHKGTAELWSYILLSQDERFFIHLDSDTIFLADVISELISAIVAEGFSVAGSRRPYLFRSYRKTGWDGKQLDKLPDVINTDCFAFDRSKIRLRPEYFLKRKIFGHRPLAHPVVDFFDPICFEILNRGGRIKYMDTPEAGNQAIPNTFSNFHNKRISFAAVGSGANFFKNSKAKSSDGYMNFALASYSLYSKHLLNKDIGIQPLNAPEIIVKLESLNKKNWTLNL